MRLTTRIITLFGLFGWFASSAQSGTVKGNNQFAMELYHKLTQNNSANFFMSPYSISSALAMVHAGAKGNTAQELAQVLHFVPEKVNQDFRKLSRSFEALSSSGIALKVANALWAAKYTTFLPTYSQKVKQDYRARVTNLDFGQKPEASRLKINQWVADQTNHKIKDLLPAGFIDGSTTLVLTNAIYFKAEWLYKFDKAKTKKLSFTTRDQSLSGIPFMHTEQNFRYFETESVQIVEIPYQDDKMSMLIWLPRPKYNLQQVTEDLNADVIEDLDYRMVPTKVKFILPRFKMTIRTSLKQHLTQLGLSSLFTSADFSGMSQAPLGSLSEVIHKAFIDVKETGTEAAAATAGSVTRSAISTPKIFRADRPFFFVIRAHQTGSVLFMGKVENPSIQK